MGQTRAGARRDHSGLHLTLAESLNNLFTAMESTG